jgi:hypothetical protein
VSEGPITNHAVVRFLERHDGFDFAGLREAFGDNDGRILDWLERNENLSAAGVRDRMMTDAVATAIASGASAVRLGPVKLVIVDGRVVTVRMATWGVMNGRRAPGDGFSARGRALERVSRRELTEQMEG